MRGLELIPTDDDDGDIFAFTMPERHEYALQEDLDRNAADYWYPDDSYWD